jgi:hypothetical protein
MHCFRHIQGLVPTLDCARPGDNSEFTSADRGIANSHYRLLRTQIERDQLVRFCDADDFRNSSQIFKAPPIDRTLVSGDANGGARCAGHRVWAQADRFDHVEHCVDVSRGRARFHYD